MANIEALNELVRVVRETPDHDFNMYKWSCGSVGCALGRAAMDGYFQDRGLRLDGKLYPYAVPTVDSYSGTYAGASLFGISHGEASNLFAPAEYYWHGWVAEPNTYISRESVIARIQHVIDHYTLQRDAHVRAYRSAQTVSAIIKQAQPVETVEA